MYTILRHPGTRRLLFAEAPPAAMAMAIAEWLYRFHSFTLECAAFLATWWALGALGVALRSLQVGKKSQVRKSEFNEVKKSI